LIGWSESCLVVLETSVEDILKADRLEKGERKKEKEEKEGRLRRANK